MLAFCHIFYGMCYIEASERFSDGRLQIDYLAASPPSRFPPPHPPSPTFPCFPSMSPVLHCSPSPPARYLGLPSPPPVLQPGRNASRGLNFASAESHTLDHRLLDAIHGSEGGYNVDGADSFYSRMAEQDAQAPRMGECGGRCGTGDGSSLIESLSACTSADECQLFADRRVKGREKIEGQIKRNAKGALRWDVGKLRA
ncbi:unnamed protein product [Closterium sp. Naga37s-1]|nr:unnamed protein product [Closterium sp. Naga37s-1]